MRVPLSLPNFRLRMMSDHAYTSFQDHSVSPPRTLSSNDPDLEMNGISQHRASISDHSDVASQANTSLNSAHALDTMNGNVSEVKPSILGSTFLEYFVTVGFIGLWYICLAYSCHGRKHSLLEHQVPVFCVDLCCVSEYA